MALEERTVIDRIEVYRDGSVGVREAREVLRDGEVIARSFHRARFDAAEDLPDLSHLDGTSREVIRAARSSERVAAAKAKRAAAERDAPTRGKPADVG